MTIQQPPIPILELSPTNELRLIFKRCHNYIYGNQGLPKDRAFHELLKIIFCKVQDERNSQIFFYVDTGQNLESEQKHLKKRIQTIFEQVKKSYPNTFRKDERIELDNRVLSFIVSELQHYSLLDTDADVKGAAYEEMIGSNLRGDRGEFFTPRNVCKMAIAMLFFTHPKEAWSSLNVIDSSCGTGGFITEVINFLRNNTNETNTKSPNLTEINIKKFCAENLFGLDINPLLIRSSEMNEILNANTSGHLYVVNSLLPIDQWNKEIKQHVKFEMFDLLFTNPPFGSLIPIDDPIILSQYDLGHSWKNDNGNYVMTNKIKNSMPPEILFIERCIQLLKPGGRMAIVLPDSILSNPGLKYVRNWILKHTQILACIDLPIETFQPFVGAKTNVVFLEKKTKDRIQNEEKYANVKHYDIFMACAYKIGHDRRGNPIYIRNSSGEEILINKQREICKISNGHKIRVIKDIEEKVTDDDLPKITSEFKKWWEKNGTK